VCSEHASCTNLKGRYECSCNSGFEGDGWRKVGFLAEEPPWLQAKTGKDHLIKNTQQAKDSLAIYMNAGYFDKNDTKEDARLRKLKCGQGKCLDGAIMMPLRLADGVGGYVQGCRNIDDCAPNRCKNKSVCKDVDVNDYHCTCPNGPTGSVAWVGKNCEIDVDECDPAEPIHDCDPHATCSNEPGKYVCNCHENWKSTDNSQPYPGGEDRKGRMWGPNEANAGCYDQPDCASAPCMHGGSCTEGPDGCEEINVDGDVVMVDCYECACAYGWTGFNCEIDENECGDSEEGDYLTVKDECHDQAFCTNVPGTYECSCNAGWTGDGRTCIDADDCEFSPCAHGGTCYDCGTLCFTCDCVVGWRGTTCATDWNECIMGIHICNNDATCVNNPGSYDCRCDPGFTGTGFGQGFTEEVTTYRIGANDITEITYKGCKDIDDCDPDLYDGPTASPNGPCIMGTCLDVGPNAYVCTCNPGYTDANCDMNVNECDPILGDNDCHRFAECTDTTGSYECQCNHGYTGNGKSSCLDISDCYSQCVHGFCSDLGIDDYQCTCDNGWRDHKCNFDINECTTYTHECARHALCTNNPGSYTCACNKGWSGDGKAQGDGCRDSDDCASNPCDYGDCTDEGADAYTCECQEGFTDFNCDFDVNECYLKTHNCHVDARCVNIPGGFFCRCLSGWEGDGLTCTDLDDCDPDPCDPTHGTCEDQGPNKYHCNCEPGWTGMHCGYDQDECEAETHGCDPYALCTNTFGSHECVCQNDYWGQPEPGATCTTCTVCPSGWNPIGPCQLEDLTCVNVDECVEETDNCHDHATCMDNEGSFKCECDQNGTGDEWWGVGINSNAGCQTCTECYDGYHEIQPCTSTTDRICEINIVDGTYMIETEADDNRMCMALLKGEWYPSRINFGNGDDYCGIAGGTLAEKKTELLGDGQTLFKFTHLGDNSQVTKSGGDMYTIEYDDGEGFRCLFFGDDGKDIYPSLQNCHSYDLANKEECPWANGGKGLDNCGFAQEGMDPRDALIDNNQAIWRLAPLKLNENKYILQSASKGNKNQDGGRIWECLAFEEQGAATNPSRYNWGNGDSWCGAGDWEGEGKVYGLLNNKQAVFILTFLQ